MTPTALVTRSTPFYKFFATAPAPASYPTLAALTADPGNTDGCLKAEMGNANPGSFLHLLPFGRGSGDVNMKIVGYKEVKGVGLNSLWIPAATLIDMSVTLGAVTGTGSSGNILLSSDKLASAIAVNSSKIAPGNKVWVADNGVAMISVDPVGFERLRLIVGTGASATAANCLFSWF